MTDTNCQDRQNLEFFRWPELTQRFQGLVELMPARPNRAIADREMFITMPARVCDTTR